MVGEGRSDDNGNTPAVLVDVAPVKPIPVPTRRTLDGAVVADGGPWSARMEYSGRPPHGHLRDRASLEPEQPAPARARNRVS